MGRSAWNRGHTLGAALVEFTGFTCPLTLLENDLRQRAGDAGYRDGFIHPWDANRAGCAAAGGDHRILELSAPAGAARGESLADSSRPEHGTRTATSGRCSRGLRTERLVHRTQGDSAIEGRLPERILSAWDRTVDGQGE
jgi:Protein of Unknown function (DUF2784)